MNILIDKLPAHVVIDGAEYAINADFRASISFEILTAGELTDDILAQALDLYYPIIPNNVTEALNQIFWFYSGGKSESVAKQGALKSAQQIYSFEYDDDYIYAAFLSQYNIDLQTVDFLHWWKFKAMFKSLRDDNQIVKIMGYRSIDIDNKMSKEQKDFYRQMKKTYALPLPKSAQEKVVALENAILNGENINNLLQDNM